MWILLFYISYTNLHNFWLILHCRRKSLGCEATVSGDNIECGLLQDNRHIKQILKWSSDVHAVEFLSHLDLARKQ